MKEKQILENVCLEIDRKELKIQYIQYFTAQYYQLSLAYKTRIV